MKKDLGLVQAVYPMPVLMVAAYDKNGKVAQAYENLTKEVMDLEERSNDRSRNDRVR